MLSRPEKPNSESTLRGDFTQRQIEAPHSPRGLPGLEVAMSVFGPSKGQRKPDVVAHACNPSIWEAETGGSRFEYSLSYFSEALHNLVRPCFK